MVVIVFGVKNKLMKVVGFFFAAYSASLNDKRKNVRPLFDYNTGNHQLNGRKHFFGLFSFLVLFFMVFFGVKHVSDWKLER